MVHLNFRTSVTYYRHFEIKYIRLEDKRKLFNMSPSLTSHEHRVQPWLNYPYELEINGSICWFIYFASFVSLIGWLSYSCSACAAVVYRSLLDRIFCPAASIHTDLHRHVSGSLMSFNSIESTCDGRKKTLLIVKMVFLSSIVGPKHLIYETVCTKKEIWKGGVLCTHF